MQCLKYGTNELIYKTETNSQIENRIVAIQGIGVGEGGTGSLELANINNYIQDG